MNDPMSSNKMKGRTNASKSCLFFVFTSCRLPGSLPQATHEAQIQFKCTVMDNIAKCN